MIGEEEKKRLKEKTIQAIAKRWNHSVLHGHEASRYPPPQRLAEFFPSRKTPSILSSSFRSNSNSNSNSIPNDDDDDDKDEGERGDGSKGKKNENRRPLVEECLHPKNLHTYDGLFFRKNKKSKNKKNVGWSM